MIICNTIESVPDRYTVKSKLFKMNVMSDFNKFWNIKENRGKYFSVKLLQSKKVNIEAKINFLKRCLKFSVIPETLKVRNAAPRGPGSQQEGVRWQDAQLRGGLALTKEALTVELELCCRLRGQTRRAVTGLEDEVGPGIWPELEVRLLRDQRIAYKGAQNRTRQRVRNLLIKAGKEIPGWLDRSGRSFLENTREESMREGEIGPEARSLRSQARPPSLTSTPVRSPAAPPGSSELTFRREERGRTEARPRLPDEEEGEEERLRGAGRRFEKRSKFINRGKILIRREIKKMSPDLFTNFSDHEMSEGQRSLLNKGPNFCPSRPKINTTEVKVSNFKWQRNMLWKEVFEGGDESEEEDGAGEVVVVEERILKKPSDKVNLPRGHSSPAELTNCIAATQVDILAAAPRSHCPNLSAEQRRGMEELKMKQKSRDIAIRRSDKCGGWVITNFDVYKAEGDRKLEEKFATEAGEEKPKYVKVSEVVLKKQHKHLKSMAEEGVMKEFLCPEDGGEMVPKEPKAARFYMNNKNHKPVDPRYGVPPWREVVSGSGSNTEGASKVVNFKKQHKHLKSIPPEPPEQRCGQLPGGYQTHAVQGQRYQHSTGSAPYTDTASVYGCMCDVPLHPSSWGRGSSRAGSDEVGDGEREGELAGETPETGAGVQCL